MTERWFYIYICQRECLNNAVKGTTGYQWPGTDAVDAVQRLQDQYPWYHNDLFIVIETDGGDVSNEARAVRVDVNGQALIEYIGR